MGGSDKTQRNEGFTEVRRKGRRSDGAVSGRTQSDNGSRAGLGRNLQEISGNIVVTNRIGGLVEDGAVGETRKATVLSEENKENAMITNQEGTGKRVPQGKEVGATVNLERVQEGLRNTFQFNQGRSARPRDSNGARGRQNRSNKPTRGLVFGLVRGETERSESGKRLRMETPSNDRTVEVFRGGEIQITEENTPHVELGEDTGNVSVNVESETLNRESSGHGISSQEVVNMTGA
ncbi:unnamed protein product [Arabis nemorensis]|uniref:Uncharacterized protein n=1 Tax=Arabis nemorensis TaxID=586526 RepID=A0A565CWH6_9BRAS|nr:unnamed protein product [Arabis nemorensis]